MNPETQAQAAIGDIIGRLASGRLVLGADTDAAVGAAEICQMHQPIVLECMKQSSQPWQTDCKDLAYPRRVSTGW